MYLIIFFVCFGASVIGSICGIGGGVIIKPLLDSFNILDVPTISFLSGITVLSMSIYSVSKNVIDGNSKINKKIGMYLSVGAVVGGVLGKILFQYVLLLSPDKNKIGAIQAMCLLVVTIGTLVYTIFKNKIQTYKIKNIYLCILIGVFLGMLSSFLGIGGGPINLVILFFFFSMNTKTAAENSLYIILYSQTASLIQVMTKKNIPEISLIIISIMVAGGIIGGILGQYINKKINENKVANLFIILMIMIIGINIYNIYKFI